MSGNDEEMGVSDHGFILRRFLSIYRLCELLETITCATSYLKVHRHYNKIPQKLLLTIEKWTKIPAGELIFKTNQKSCFYKVAP